MKKHSIIILIAATAFLNFIGLTLAFPVFTPLFTSTTSALVPHEMTKVMRAVLLGIAIGIYPFVQFFTAPILGILSDRVGRKPVLFYTAIGNIASHVLVAVGVTMNSIVLVLAGRVLGGLFSGALAVTQSAMSDISTHESRPRNYGLLGAMFGAALALGPAIGGVLSDHHYGPLFTLATPFYLAAFLSLLNVVLIGLLFIETHRHENRRSMAVSFLTGPKQFIHAFTIPSSRALFVTAFLLFFGFNFFTGFFQYYLIERFHVTNTQFGMLFGYIGIWSILTQGVLTRPVSKRFSPAHVLRVTLLSLSLVFPVMLLVPNYWLLYAVVFLSPMMVGLSGPNLMTIISGLADASGQGRILGINQSVQAAAQFIPPLVGGYLVGLNYTMPLWVAFAAIFIAWVVFLFFSGMHRVPGTHKR
ncbi:MAG: MFS transporter [Spirochaetota bacterium]